MFHISSFTKIHKMKGRRSGMLVDPSAYAAPICLGPAESTPESGNENTEYDEVNAFCQSVDISQCQDPDAVQVYRSIALAPDDGKRTIKIDLCPSVTPQLAVQVFEDVARFCGFAGISKLNDDLLVMSKLNSHHILCGPKKETHFEFCVMQEIVVRNYGSGSAKYAALYLTWLDQCPKLVRQGSGGNLNLLSQGLAQVLGKKLKVSKKGSELLVEEIVGRWRAILFQREYALEAAKLENTDDAPWKSLAPDEVDYEDSDDEREETENFQVVDYTKHGHNRHDEHLPPPPPPKIYPDMPSIPPVMSSSSVSVETPARKQDSKRKHNSISHGLARPKSALKLPHDKFGKRHDRKKPVSVRFCQQPQVQELDISRESREARMGDGCSATNQFGQERPLTSTRTGDLIFVHSFLDEGLPPPPPPPPHPMMQRPPSFFTESEELDFKAKTRDSEMDIVKCRRGARSLPAPPPVLASPPSPEDLKNISMTA